MNALARKRRVIVKNMDNVDERLHVVGSAFERIIREVVQILERKVDIEYEAILQNTVRMIEDIHACGYLAMNEVTLLCALSPSGRLGVRPRISRSLEVGGKLLATDTADMHSAHLQEVAYESDVID